MFNFVTMKLNKGIFDNTNTDFWTNPLSWFPSSPLISSELFICLNHVIP